MQNGTDLQQLAVRPAPIVSSPKLPEKIIVERYIFLIICLLKFGSIRFTF